MNPMRSKTALILSIIRRTEMQDKQNAFQNAGQYGSFFYLSVGNQSSTFLVLVLAFILLRALLISEERYRKLVEIMYLTISDR
jgi:hypothetical protein